MFSATKGGSPSGYQISRSVRLRSSRLLISTGRWALVVRLLFIRFLRG
jgi:hypothetical protein